MAPQHFDRAFFYYTKTGAAKTRKGLPALLLDEKIYKRYMTF